MKGRRIRADVLYGQTLGPDARTPEELARDYNLPQEAVREAVEYCLHDEDVLRRDFEMEEAAERRRIDRVARLGPENGRES